MQFLDGYCQEPFFAKNSSNFINAFPRRSDVHTTISPFFPASLYKTIERTNWTWKLFESPKGSYFTKNANIQPDFLFPFDDHHFLTSFASFVEEVKMKKYAVHTHVGKEPWKLSIFYVWTSTKCDNKSISLIKMSNKSHSLLPNV